MSHDVLFLDVPEKEADTHWHNFARSVDNLDVVNSVKNRRHKHSTTEYFNGGFKLHEGTHHNLPILLCIMVGFNNNTNNNADFNFIVFQLLLSSMTQGYHPTIMVPVLTTMISIIDGVRIS
eukprot:scaffold2902_cov120-Skeletonema_menzelii.AAC.3